MSTVAQPGQPAAGRTLRRRLARFGDALLTYGAAVVIALVINAIFIALAGGDILVGYQSVLHASFGSVIGMAQTLNKWTPLLLGGLAVAIGTRGGVFNIGVDGQIYIGAVFATGLGFALAPLGLPPIVLVPTLLIAGVIGGAIWAGIAGYLRAKFEVNEIFTTVMLNFIAFYVVQYLAIGPWNDPMAGEAITLPIPAAAKLPALLSNSGAHTGIVLALLAVAGVGFLLNRTKLGYNMRAAGDNPVAAGVAGINVPRNIVVTLALSGALAGLAGAVEVTGVHGRLILGLSPAYGTMSILIAAVGNATPLGILAASAFFAVLFVGADALQRSIAFPASAVLVFQAVMFLVIIWIRLLRENRGQRRRPAQGEAS